jgi:hypothetical protein
VSTIQKALLRSGHLVWIISLVNVSLGFFISGFNPIANSISAVGLEEPVYAYTHRAADIVIGLSMCVFGVGLSAVTNGRARFTLIATCLLGASFVSAGIWTLDNPLHLLYNLSIVMIIVPVACALELKTFIRSAWFASFCLTVSFIHVFMFWSIYAGFIPQDVAGLIQRIWTLVLVGWFGITTRVLVQESANSFESDASKTTRASS